VFKKNHGHEEISSSIVKRNKLKLTWRMLTNVLIKILFKESMSLSRDIQRVKKNV